MSTKTMTICGTRPELIKISEIIKQLDIYTNHVLVHTAQNYDYELSQIFFNELGIRKPDYTLNVKADTIGGQIANIMTQCEQVMLKEKPEVVFILGDTNSALSCIIAKRLRIIIYHLEAGNRCFDNRVPEEINRRIIDHTADINMCYTEHARRNLLNEGIPTQNIFVVGSPLWEVYNAHMLRVNSSKILEKLNLIKNNYILASIHREENVTIGDKLLTIMDTLVKLTKIHDMPIIFTTHPRTRNYLEDSGFKHDRIILHKPFGMFDYINLQKNAFCNVSDSGTAHEDAALLGIPMVIVRESNERPEAYDTGNVIMTGLDGDTINDSVGMVIKQRGVHFTNPYGKEPCSQIVVRLILGQHGIISKKEYYEL